MSGLWRRLDPMHPYRAERAQGTDAWLSAAVAFYSASWQLLAPSTGVLLLVPGLTSVEAATWWLFSPSIATAIAGAWCSLSHHVKDDAFRWWGPWTLIAPAGAGLVYALGRGRRNAGERAS